ncbi:1-phosphatidylinositol 4,5-bisphosphate phosphodiesterase delta-4-like, partial [Saccoglossus kowalevskii]|uniref:Phosphoinositide phospholipase C n=1 Tax=Saccoglossus kowalevskii TaxID=10224 RepID=A0ABM0MEP8_SACKO
GFGQQGERRYWSARGEKVLVTRGKEVLITQGRGGIGQPRERRYWSPRGEEVFVIKGRGVIGHPGRGGIGHPGESRYWSFEERRYWSARGQRYWFIRGEEVLVNQGRGSIGQPGERKYWSTRGEEVLVNQGRGSIGQQGERRYWSTRKQEVLVIQGTGGELMTQERDTFYEMSSFGESKAMELAKEQGRGYVEHNKFQLSRTYPGGMRTNSSNYMPYPLWNAGCQIVALNYQTAGDEMDINLGKFRQNGNSGYILKPVFMRKESSHFDPEKPGEKMKQKLKIQVISGQQLPKPPGSKEIIDPYVKINTFGVPSDCFDVKTKVIDNN